ncbi:hypothetical protein ACAW74_24015 [Fibrella sp. WM1]|uniref:hypothetical protein n=1 Tax=Fibrella musci TaxID=3242485 RepID=UPI003520DD8A
MREDLVSLNRNLKAVGESRKAYVYMKDGFQLMDKNVEFYFSTGLYNYYVERYPIGHSVKLTQPALKTSLKSIKHIQSQFVCY